jgi:hypothetical protein
MGTIAYTSNHRYSGGRDQEDSGLRPALAESSRNLIPTNKKLSFVECSVIPAT